MAVGDDDTVGRASAPPNDNDDIALLLRSLEETPSVDTGPRPLPSSAPTRSGRPRVPLSALLTGAAILMIVGGTALYLSDDRIAEGFNKSVVETARDRSGAASTENLIRRDPPPADSVATDQPRTATPAPIDVSPAAGPAPAPVAKPEPPAIPVPAARTTPTQAPQPTPAPVETAPDATPEVAKPVVSAKSEPPKPSTTTPAAGPRKPAPAPVAGPVKSAPPVQGGYAILVGSFTVEANAADLARKLTLKGFPASVVGFLGHDGREWRAVRVGPYKTADEARRVSTRLPPEFKLRPRVVGAR